MICVSSQHVDLIKANMAQCAIVVLLTAVNFLVTGQCRVVHESFVTHLATQVYMINHCCALVEFTMVSNNII